MVYSAKATLRANIERRFRSNPEINSPTKLAAKCLWPRGKKKGQRIAARTIGYIFELGDDSPSPSLDVVEAVAKALRVETWELLVDTEQSRRNMVEKILSTEPAAADDKDVWKPTPMLQEKRAAYTSRSKKGAR